MLEDQTKQLFSKRFPYTSLSRVVFWCSTRVSLFTRVARLHKTKKYSVGCLSDLGFCLTNVWLYKANKVECVSSKWLAFRNLAPLLPKKTHTNKWTNPELLWWHLCIYIFISVHLFFFYACLFYVHFKNRKHMLLFEFSQNPWPECSLCISISN